MSTKSNSPKKKPPGLPPKNPKMMKKKKDPAASVSDFYQSPSDLRREEKKAMDVRNFLLDFTLTSLQ
jgi:hypothetical protein